MKHSRWFLAVLGVLLIACHGGLSSAGYQVAGSNAWYREDTIELSLLQCDLCPQHDLSVIVRYTDEYRYRNLDLLAELQGEDGTVVCRDTLHFDMFDERDHPLGSGFGRYAQTARRASVALQPGCAYRLRLVHLMRLNPLQGITDFSFALDSARHPSSER